MRKHIGDAIVEVNRKNSRATTTTTTEKRKPPQKKPAIDNKKLATKKREKSTDFLKDPLSINHHCNYLDYLIPAEVGVASAPVGDDNFAASLAKQN